MRDTDCSSTWSTPSESGLVDQWWWNGENLNTILMRPYVSCYHHGWKAPSHGSSSSEQAVTFLASHTPYVSENILARIVQVSCGPWLSSNQSPRRPRIMYEEDNKLKRRGRNLVTRRWLNRGSDSRVNDIWYINDILFRNTRILVRHATWASHIDCGTNG